LVLAVIVACGAVAIVAFAPWGGDDNAGNSKEPPTTTPSATVLQPGQKAQVSTDPKTISIFSTPALSQVLEQLTTAYKTAHPALTFQVTTGTTTQLLDQIQQGARPNLYIDDAQVIGRLEKTIFAGKPVEFGTDAIIVVVKAGNPDKVGGLNVFGADPSTTSGVCVAEIPCGAYAEQLLAAAKLTPIPDVTESDQAALVDDVAIGDVDAALVMRSAARNRFFKLSPFPLWTGPSVEVKYDIASLAGTKISRGFIRFTTTFQAGKRILAARGFLPLSILATAKPA
jgi:molybdate transport system substrate-binding protein